MSRYKTPFSSQFEHSKLLENRTSKYRLPFKKDEPVQDLTKTLNNLSQHNITLQSDIKMPKLTMSSDIAKPLPPLKHKNNMNTHEEVNVSVKSDRQELFQNYNDGGSAFEKAKLKPQESEKSQRELGDSQRQKDETKTRPKLSMQGKKKRRFLSSASRYGDDQYVDNTEQSEDEFQSRKDRVRSLENELPIIGQSKNPRIEKEDSEEDYKIWQNLSKDIEQYQQMRQKKMLQKNKIRRKQSKRRKTISKKLQKPYEKYIQIIENQLRKNPNEIMQRRSQSYAENPDMYELVKQQNRSSPNYRVKTGLEDKQMNQSLNMMDKLREIIAIRNSKLKRSKLKLPLEFYLNSYEQIKSINPFFRKLSQMEGCILLNIGKLAVFQANKSIYSLGDTLKEIYIIIYGKVSLSNKYKTLKKFAVTGQTLGEQELFQNEKSYIQRLKDHSRPNLHKYDAKALNKCCLLRIKLSKYYKMSCELNRMGYKQQFNLIDNLFRINFINKQTNLRYNERDRIQTDSSMPKPTLRHGSFFY